MNVVAFILLLVGAILFGVDAVMTKRLITFGLFFLALALIVQFATTSHTFTL